MLRACPEYIEGTNGRNLKCLRKSVHADSSTDSELKAVEEACPEAPRTVEAFGETFLQPVNLTAC
jgi:hypothetical protein